MKKVIVLSIFCLVFNGKLNAQIQYQEQSMWCWASCIQSALAQANVNETQSQIVSKLAGWPQNRPANNAEVISILNYYNFRAWSVEYPATPQQLYDTLHNRWKVIAFVNPSDNPYVGHFIMLQGISPNGLIIVSDPSSGMTYEQSLNTLYYSWKWTSSIVVGTP